jgi:hypothetical protein
MTAHEKCVLGCNAPAVPPSMVICQGCMDRIGENMKVINKALDKANGAKS